MLRLLSTLAGPVFAKEMVEIARRKRYYFNRVLYGLVLLFTLFLVWDSFGWRLAQAGGPTIRLMADMAQALFHGVSAVQYGAVFLFVPLFLCGVIASEREEQTLELLFTTQLKDREIVLGKLLSRITALVALILFALPVVSLTLFFGGVDPEGVWRILAATLLAVLYCGAMAMYFSAVTKSPMGALVRTYWWMALWILALPIAVIMPISAIPHRPNQMHPVIYVLSTLAFINPIGPFITAYVREAYDEMATHLGGWFFPFTFIPTAVWSLFLIWRAVRRVRLAPTPVTLFVKRIPIIRHIRHRLQTLRELPARRGFGRPEIVALLFRVRNPLWLRSRRARVYDREGYIGRIQWAAWFLAGFLLLLVLIFVLPQEVGLFRFDVNRLAMFLRELSLSFLAPTWIGIAALAVILAGSSLVGDRRKGFLDLVLVTPLSARDIIDGTIAAVWTHWRRLYWLAWFLAAIFVIALALLGRPFLLAVMLSLFTATLFCLLVIVYGVAFALCARTLPGALVPAFIFPLLVNAGIPFLIPIFRSKSGAALWVVTAIALLVSWYWVRRRTSVASVACYFMAAHLTLVSLASFWTSGEIWPPWGGIGEEYPIAAMHPGHLTIATLEREQNDWFRHGNRTFPWQAIYGCYCTALVVNIVWARWWLIRNFEQLVDRVRPAIRQERRAVHLAGELARRGQVVSRDSTCPQQADSPAR
jgi:ABC-type transport system involved in multi-copper enzyme maturation permease subunit